MTTTDRKQELYRFFEGVGFGGALIKLGLDKDPEKMKEEIDKFLGDRFPGITHEEWNEQCERARDDALTAVIDKMMDEFFGKHPA